MAPRMREAHEPAPPPLLAWRSGPFSRAHRQNLPPPRPPFEPFPPQYLPPNPGEHGEHVQEFASDVPAGWDRLSPQERQLWEQHGKQVLEYQEAYSSALNHNTSSNVISMNVDDGASGDWSTESEMQHRPISYRDSKASHTSARQRIKKPRDSQNQGPSASSVATPKATAKVIYRTELYRVKKDVDGNLVSDYTKSTRHDQPPQLKLTSALSADNVRDPVDEILPVFEVTTFLAAPLALNIKDLMKQSHGNKYPKPVDDIIEYGGRLPYTQRPTQRSRFNVDSSTPSDDDFPDEESEIDPEKPIEIEGEAGTILEIHSPLIIDAIQKVAPGYPGLSVEGSSLTVTEPFCGFIHFRDQMKGYYEPIEGQSDQQPPLHGKGAASEAAENSDDSKAPIGMPLDGRQEGAAHVSELYGFIDQLYLKSVSCERERWTHQVPMCTFEWVWLLFPPQTLIYEPKSLDSPVSRTFRVKGFKLQGLFRESRRSHTPSVNPHRLNSRQDPHFKNHLERVVIVASYLKHDGRKWMSPTKEFQIFPFKGEKRITDLPVYPAKFFEDSDGARRRRLIQRGKRYHSLISRGQFEYHGETLSGARRRLDSRIMVDSETYYYDRGLTTSSRNRDVSPYGRRRDLDIIERNPSSDSEERSVYSVSASGTDSDDGPFNIIKEPARSRGRHSRRPKKAKPQLQALLDNAAEGDREADELFMICHSELRAYVLKEREWVRLSVESISLCSFDERMIDDLQITPEAKRLIQAFSQSYTMSLGSPIERRPVELPTESWSADFVPGKGRGQIMLLHGRPGVGKTTCAECIAELTRRPLLTITCGDLGTNSHVVEQELTRWLRLGALWNAVLLFDEADVFLESREHGDIERNSLVSVFLRALEYYQGLMFLTTNRIGTFDEAILSRVHVILHFPDLTDTERAKIWDTSFRKLAEERPNIKIDFSLYDLAYRDDNIKKLNWNGREIRNAFNTMIALAEFDAHQNNRYSKDGKVEVRREHLHEVAMMSGSFKKYMQSLRGLSDAGYAKGLGLRDDEFGVERRA